MNPRNMDSNHQTKKERTTQTNKRTNTNQIRTDQIRCMHQLTVNPSPSCPKWLAPHEYRLLWQASVNTRTCPRSAAGLDLAFTASAALVAFWEVAEAGGSNERGVKPQAMNFTRCRNTICRTSFFRDNALRFSILSCFLTRSRF